MIMRMNLQYFGGRGSSSSLSTSITFGAGTSWEKTYKADAKTKQFFEENMEFWKDFGYGEHTKDEVLSKAKSFFEKYQKGTANENNFFINTIAEFEDTKRPRRPPDHVSVNPRTGKVSSEYWYTDEGVIRGSDHWGEGVASCDWYLKSQSGKTKGLSTNTGKKYGKVSWDEFTQKTEVETDPKKGKAILSNFDNTLGKTRNSMGRSTLKIKGINDK